MTTIRDSWKKSEAKCNTVSDLMEKKRKLYLLKRVKSADGTINNGSSSDVKSFGTSQQQTICCAATKENITSSKFLIPSSTESTFDIEENISCKSKPELCICHGNIRLRESDDYCCTSPFNNNCSCNKNCHISCRLPYHHHKNVLNNKSAQNFSVSHPFRNNNSNNQEIYMQNSYYFLSNLQELSLAQTGINTIKTSCAPATKFASENYLVTTMPATVHPATKLLAYSSHRKEYSPTNNMPCNRQLSTKKKTILQFCNIIMILKMLLVFITRTQPLLSSGRFAPLKLQKTKHLGNYQNSSIQVNQRLRNFQDQLYSHCNKQKSSLHTPNVSLTKMILLSLSFLLIFLPFSQPLSFETTLQSGLAALERTARDVAITEQLQVNHSMSRGNVLLSRPEHVCKSLDIRNTAEQFQQVENCTVIEGFLLITLLNGNSLEDYNGTFPLLTEITDFLLVYQVHYLRSIGRIFPNLSIIRGINVFGGYALIVYSNSHLEELGLTKLTTISRGSVRIEKNVMLCFVKSIDWSQIVTDTTDIVIEENRDSVECPACPGDSIAEENELSCKERHGMRHCWNSKSCQKFCPKECPNNCVDENTCCNEACLGGCSPNNLNECISCRNFSIYNTTCIDKCPDNYYKYLDRRCLTAESCSIIGTKFENNRQEVLVAYEGSCSTGCPEGYTKENMTCVKCGDKCIKKCEGSIIDSVERAKELHMCTHIVQSPLIINIKRGGRYLMEQLSYGLSAIISIESSLKVQGTYGIFNLKFFKNLQRIEGQNLVEKKYALYILENTGIEKIWNPNQTVQILRGGVYIHFNPKLCLSEINSLLPMLNQTKFDQEEVSEENGSRGTCNAALLNVTVFNVGSLTALARIENPMIYEDERTFIGYQFLHIEDPFGNATKHSFRPCEDEWVLSDPNKETFHLFQGLKPYTRYAFYVETLTISTERRKGQSEIHHFKTKSDKPQNVIRLQSYSNSSYSIVMNWLPPSTANGKLIKYKVRAVYDKRTQRIESRNYCKDPLKEISKHLPVITEEPVLPKNCNCKKGNALTYEDDEIDASIHESIELENSLQNFVYVKKERKRTNTKSANSYELFDQNSNRNRRASESDHFDSFLLRHMRDVPGKKNSAYDIITTTTSTTSTTTASSVVPHHEGIPFFNETLMDPEGEYYEVFVDSVSASTTEYVFTKLKHFSRYMLGVEACREKDSENDTLDCSNEVKTYVRTLKLENVDRVEELRGVRETTNSSRSNIRLFWERPARPNGEVVSYTIFYLLKSQDAVEEKKCITESDYVELGYQQNGYVLTNLNPGNYTIRISTNTLAGEGQSSKAIYIDITPSSLPLSIIIGIAVGALLTVVIIGGLTCYLCRKLILAPPSDLKIFPSVNPHYISLQYVPDDWELKRETIIQLNPLGQGSFGMVYEGILKDYKVVGNDVACAIKTVNESATDRERLNFLNEACVMKQFDTYHVVRLMGVCSLGQPALVAMELMKKGDLKSYLRAHRPDEPEELGLSRSTPSVQPPTIRRIYQMAIEIADGMAYLAAKKFVHRDLAARNCMVAADLTVKIGDFGMTRDIYENDYYRKGTKGLLPVRWMSPESLRDGIYSTASDAFSYGVVLWEMATLASQPYQGLLNDQVLRYVIDGGVMERPDNCPDKLYNLMQKCWHHRPSARPSFMEIIRHLLDFADPHFQEVSFYHSETGQQIFAKETTGRAGNVFEDGENDLEDVTTPLRLEEYNVEYKMNLDNNSSVGQRADSSMAIDDDAPHSPYSLTGSPLIVSSTPDEYIRNNYNMSRIINSHNQILSSAPSTSAELRKTSLGISNYPHPHTHPHHRNFYQPTRYGRYNRSDDVDAYVPSDFELKDLMEMKRTPEEQGYEMYDPSPNYSEKITANVHDDEEDDVNVHSNAGQNLLSRSKARHRQPAIMPLSSSMPDDVIGQQQSSALHPSIASAASSNASFKTGKYHGLKAAADFGNNMTAKFRSILFNTHKRSGSNASYKSTSSNPKSATTSSGAGISSGSSNNITRGGRGKSMSGQNLATIESGGSGSAGSYCANPQANTSKDVLSTSENPIYKRLDDGSGIALSNKPKLPTSSVFSMSSNPNYQVLDESFNTTGASTSADNAAAGSPLLETSENPNYQLMQAPAIQKLDNVSSYVMMNEPNPSTSAISTSSNSNCQMMGPLPLPPPSVITRPTSTSVLPQSSGAESRTVGGGETATRKHSKKNSSSSSAVSSSQESDDDIPNPKGIKSDRIPLSRSSSKDRSQKKKNYNNRSRSQSSSSSRGSNTATKTSQPQQQQSSANPMSLIASSTLLTKENWLKQQPAQPHHNRSQPPPPPPNGFVGRETS